jgi:hypothetical protein
VFCGHPYAVHDEDGLCGEDCPCGWDLSWMAQRERRMPSMARLQLAEHVLRLYGESLSRKDIAEQLGITPSYVTELKADPDGSRAKARKASYAGTCEACGNPTNGSNGPGKAARFCTHCSPAHQQLVWTVDEVLRVLRELATSLGHVPAAQRTQEGEYDGLARLPEGAISMRGMLSAAQLRLGGWNAAIRAAGLEPRKSGHRIGGK